MDAAPSTPLSSVNLSPEQWDQWRTCVPDAAYTVPLGTLATDVGAYWPASRGSEPLGDFLDLSLGQLRSLRGMGTKKLDGLVAVVQALSAGGVVLRPASITAREVGDGERAEREQRLHAQIRENIEALGTSADLSDIIRDLRDTLAEVAACRATAARAQNIDRNRDLFAARLAGQTLAEIGDMHGMTRERVRQITLVWRSFVAGREPWLAAIQHVLLARIAAGTAPLSLADARSLVALVVDGLGGGDALGALVSGTLHAATAAELRRASANGETPIPLPSLAERVRARLPDVPLPDSLVRQLADAVGVRVADLGPEPHHLARSTRDRIWAACHRAAGPVAAADLARSLRPLREESTLATLAGDRRFVYLDGRRWDLVERALTPAMRAGLLPLADGREVAVDAVAAIVRDHLAALDIASVTAHGFVSAADRVCRDVHGSGLALPVTAYTVQPVLMHHSRIYETGRRLRIRLRGTDPGEQDTAPYWIGRVLRELGGAALMADVMERLDALYQNTSHSNNHGVWAEMAAASGRIETHRLGPQGPLVLMLNGWDAVSGEVTPRVQDALQAFAASHASDVDALGAAGPLTPLVRDALRHPEPAGAARRRHSSGLTAELRLESTDGEAGLQARLGAAVEQAKRDDAQRINASGVERQVRYLSSRLTPEALVALARGGVV